MLSFRHWVDIFTYLIRLTAQRGERTVINIDKAFREAPLVHRRYCEYCSRLGYSESSGDGQFTCISCGEVDEDANIE
jgi:hypothetical protein